MPGQRRDVLDWPYVEGLRIDEAMHPLTLLAVGLYGKRAAQPERRAAAARRAVEVRLQGHQVDRQDRASSRDAAADHVEPRWRPSEYGFYANVNPAVDHPRWSQATERRIGEFLKRRRRCRSTATPTRWRSSTPAWTCAATSEAPARRHGRARAAAPRGPADLRRERWCRSCSSSLDALRGRLGANPIEAVLNRLRLLDARLLLLALARRRRSRGSPAGRGRPPTGACSASSPSSTPACTSPRTSASTRASTGARSWRTS